MRRHGIARVVVNRPSSRRALGAVAVCCAALVGFLASYDSPWPTRLSADEAPGGAAPVEANEAPAATTSNTKAPGPAAETLEQRRERIAKLTGEELEELNRKREVFEELSPEKQQQLRDLHRLVDESENAAELRETMRRYSAWLRTLPAGRRAELASLPTEERLAQVRQLLEQQRREQEQRMPRPPGRSLKGDDAKVLGVWIDEILTTHESQIAAMIPAGPFRDRYRQISDPQRRRASLIFTLSRRMSEGGPPLEFPTDEEYAKLTAGLSPAARQELETLATRKEKSELVFEWARTQFFSQFQIPQPPQPSREELEKYFREEVNANDRAWLEGLPPERFARELRRHYQMQQMRRSFDGQRGGAGAPGKPLGPGLLPKPPSGRGPDM